MSGLTAEQRGDLAEDMLPVAAHLAVLVHGDGGPEDIQEVLAGLDDAQRNALIVVLAGLVDPEQPMGRALGWLDFNENGALTVPHWGEHRPVRDLAAVPDPDCGSEYVDPVAVQRFVDGYPVNVSDAELLVALEKCAGRGMSLRQVDQLRRLPKGTTANAVNRLRKAYTRAGRELPSVLRSGKKQTDFTAAQVVEIREKYAAGGVTDLELSMQYGRSRKTITSLLSGVSYRDAGGPIRAPRGPKPKEVSRAGLNGRTGPVPAVGVARAS
ncbi:hypothetical protein [Streptomyces sp. sk2.1]|uniref:hypothetical protein n=1 Tax=Streptomyces sp. sk2.1 TaxID=2478959 RepID=UPI0011E7B266|nr:hypothetical protein [Streptomyces sp. sk2.1]TXS68886.1 hypothetical protein EAO76_26330 [Streptomyces sp. sk2.1]